MNRGNWAFYQGEEVRVIRHSQKKFELYVRNPSLMHLGFKLNLDRVYSKKVKKFELDSIYYIDNKALYKERVFHLSDMKEDCLLLYGIGEDCEKFGFNQIDRGEYEKWVKREEVDCIWAARTPTEDLPLPENQLKTGIWALYKGMEFIVERESDRFELYSYDPSLTAIGFVPYYNKYLKFVDKSDIDAIYYYDNYAEYKGNTVSVIDSVGNNILLYGMDFCKEIEAERSEVKKQDGFVLRMLEKWFTVDSKDKKSNKIEIPNIDDSCKYERWVKRDQVDRIWTIRRPIWGFPEPNINE
ncbi:hypothetical protein [Brevibacillus sp. SYSU BS000544]|uniref:hypothetical protein n=1 Tax=Brevibacillus sp. SYSU BS000544 TaxID=3416443 RepID=UPI003CE47A18